MRVVIDTNVLVGACIGRGASSHIVEACLEGRLVPIIGSTLFLEYQDVLSREAIFGRARLNAPQRQIVLRSFVSVCRWQSIAFKWRPNLADEADNHVLELAVAANGARIVTNNVRDFLRGDLRFAVKIETPEMMLERLRR